jgi:hypothetical protein
MPSITSVALLVIALALFATADAECDSCQLPCHCVRMRTGQYCDCAPKPKLTDASAGLPPAPAPTPPPAPTSDETFTEKACKSSKCESCMSTTFAANKCFGTQGGGSAIATCGDGTSHTRYQLTQRVYKSANCTGDYQSEGILLNQCLQDGAGAYFEVTCGRSFADDAAITAGAKLRRARAV